MAVTDTITYTGTSTTLRTPTAYLPVVTETTSPIYYHFENVTAPEPSLDDIIAEEARRLNGS